MRVEVLGNPCVLGVPIQGDKIKSGYPILAFLGAHTRADRLRNTCVLGAPIKGDKVKSGYLSRAFLGAYRRVEVLRNWCVLHQRGQIKRGCLTLAFSGAHRTEEMLLNRCVIGGPHQREQNQKWLPQPCLLGDLHECGSATEPLRSQGTPSKGTKSKVATSPLPSWWPT